MVLLTAAVTSDLRDEVRSVCLYGAALRFPLVLVCMGGKCYACSHVIVILSDWDWNRV